MRWSGCVRTLMMKMRQIVSVCDGVWKEPARTMRRRVGKGGRGWCSADPPLPTLRSQLSPFDRDHIDSRGKLLPPRGEHDAVDWGNVGVVAADGEYDVVLARDQRIGGVEAAPAGGAAPYHHPGM